MTHIRELHISLRVVDDDIQIANVPAGYYSASYLYWALSVPDGLLIHVHWEGEAMPDDDYRDMLNQTIGLHKDLIEERAS
jgi:hypothetical protein